MISCKICSDKCWGRMLAGMYMCDDCIESVFDFYSKEDEC